MRPGTRIVANSFNMEDWEADQTETITGDCTSWCTALLWIVPAKVEGSWTLPQGELKLTQQFQKVTGTLGTQAISEGKLRGDEMTFKVGTTTYTGKVDGNTIRGSQLDRDEAWTAGDEVRVSAVARAATTNARVTGCHRARAGPDLFRQSGHEPRPRHRHGRRSVASGSAGCGRSRPARARSPASPSTSTRTQTRRTVVSSATGTVPRALVRGCQRRWCRNRGRRAAVFSGRSDRSFVAD